MYNIAYNGLTSAEAAARLELNGPNARPATKPKTLFKRLWEIVSEPMMILLVATSAIYFLVGSLAEATIIFISIIPLIIIEFFQGRRMDRAVAALSVLHVEMCQVYRDGKTLSLPGTQLVPGDLVYLTAGDKVPADGVVVFTPGIMVDESILTGESVSVEKIGASGNEGDKFAEAACVCQGTMVVQGEARVVITATGLKTKYGKLGTLMEGIAIEATPLQKKIEHLIKRVAVAAIAISFLIGIVLTIKFGFVRGLLGALTVAIAIIPEEFPIVFSVFLLMGVWRMSKRKALVREMALVETLGSATVICTDKTGTLTEGSMALKKFYFAGKIYNVDDNSVEAKNKCATFLADAILALERVAVDPIELETQRVARLCGLDVEKHFADRVLMQDSSFNATTKLVQHSWKFFNDGVTQYIGGAPEQVIARSSLSDLEQKQVTQEYEKMAGEGYRVIGIGRVNVNSEGTLVERGWEFRGLLAMVDPPRAEVAEAIATCRSTGIRVLMITGDNELTARHVAGAIGLPVIGRVIHGSDLAKLSSDELKEVVKESTIYCRVQPEQKYNIVEALQTNGEVVAMTGDGVNDAPALKKATIGIAMGKRGTEVARAAAGMVLLDDNFASIVEATKEGRRIYDNLRRAFVFLFSLHAPIIGLAIVPLFLGQDLFFFPIQIIFLELFGDPAAVIGFERDVLRRGALLEKPRPANEPLLDPRLWTIIILFGGVIFAVSFGIYYYIGLRLGNIPLGQTLAFIALVFCQLFLIIFSREWHQVKSNKVLLAIVMFTLMVFEIVVWVPPLRNLFHFVPISLTQNFVVVAGSILIMFLLSRSVKFLRKRGI